MNIELDACYIVCPDMKCEGFYHHDMQCQISQTSIDLFPTKNFKMCPHLDTAKKVVFCANKHPMESKVNSSNWTRQDCTVDNCHSISFAKMSNRKIRISLEEYNNFLKLIK